MFLRESRRTVCGRARWIHRDEGMGKKEPKLSDIAG